MNRNNTKTGARSYRISTQIRDDYGRRLERLQALIRKDCGKKPKIAELIELGIKELEETSKISSAILAGQLRGDSSYDVAKARKHKA